MILKYKERQKKKNVKTVTFELPTELANFLKFAALKENRRQVNILTELLTNFKESYNKIEYR